MRGDEVGGRGRTAPEGHRHDGRGAAGGVRAGRRGQAPCMSEQPNDPRDLQEGAAAEDVLAQTEGIPAAPPDDADETPVTEEPAQEG